jgi:hypothetical protein
MMKRLNLYAIFILLIGIFVLSMTISCDSGGSSGIFVAVGDNGRIMTSPDGTTWTDETEAGDDLWSIAYF